MLSLIKHKFTSRYEHYFSRIQLSVGIFLKLLIFLWFSKKDLDSVQKALKREGKELKGSVISVSAHSSEDDEDDKSTTCYPVFVSGLPMGKPDLLTMFVSFFSHHFQEHNISHVKTLYFYPF